MADTVRRSCQTKGGKITDLLLQLPINTLHAHLNALFDCFDGILITREKGEVSKVFVFIILDYLPSLNPEMHLLVKHPKETMWQVPRVGQ